MALGESRRELQTTWVGFAVILALFGSISVYKHGVAWPFLFGASAFFALVAATAPLALLPLYRLWAKLAALMAWVNTRILLGCVFYLVITPIGAVLRALGKDVLDERLDRSAASCWQARTPRAGADEYFRQF